MRYRLMDMLQCPFCSTFPFQVFVLESDINQPRTDGQNTQNTEPFCAHYCGFQNIYTDKAKDPLSVPCGKCRETEIMTGILYCPGCERWFPIRKGIPSLLSDKLRDTDEGPFLYIFRDLLPEDVYQAACSSTLQRQSNGFMSDVEKDKQIEMNLRDRESDIYDSLYPDDKFKTELDTYDRLFEPADGAYILDLGCGTGRVTKNLLYKCQNKCAFIVGLDLSLKSLVFFRSHMNSNERRKIDLIQGDVCHVPFRTGFFDQVVSTGLFYHIPSTKLREKGLQHTARVLKAEGVIIVAVYNFNLLKRAMGFIGLTQIGRKEGHKAENGSYYYNYTPREFADWLQPYFHVTDLEGIDNRLPLVQHISARFNARLDQLLSHTPLSLPIFAREMVAKGLKKHHG